MESLGKLDFLRRLGLPPGFARFLQTVFCFAVALADLNHVQLDSQSEVIDLRNFLPEFVLKTVLPSFYAYSCYLSTFGFTIEITAVSWKRTWVISGFPVLLWFTLLGLHCIPENGFIGREDLYILQLLGALATLITSLARSAVAIGDQEGSLTDVNSYSNGTIRPSAFSSPDISTTPAAEILSYKSKKQSNFAASTAFILHGVQQSRSHGGLIQKRRHKWDSNSAGRVGKLRTALKLGEVWDDGSRADAIPAAAPTAQPMNSRQVESNREPFALTPSKFRSTVSSAAGTPTIVSGDLERDDVFKMGSSCSPSTVTRSTFSIAPSTIGIAASIYSRAPPLVSDSDTLSVFSATSGHYAPSTSFYAPSSIVSSIAPPKTSCKEETTPEWKWKVVTGLVLLLSISMNAAVLGYLLSTRR